MYLSLPVRKLYEMTGTETTRKQFDLQRFHDLVTTIYTNLTNASFSGFANGSKWRPKFEVLKTEKAKYNCILTK